MSIALTLQKYLTDHNVAYDLLPHLWRTPVGRRHERRS
jgi:hypothetical protein